MDAYVKSDKPKKHNAVLIFANEGIYKYKLRGRYFTVDTNKAFEHASKMLKNGL